MTRSVGAALVALLALGAGGCGDEDPSPRDDRSPAVTSTISGTTQASAAATEAGVAPATGARISGSIASVKVPAEWNAEPLLDDSGGNAAGPDARYQVLLTDTETTLPDTSLDGLVALNTEFSAIDPPAQRLPDVTIAGQPAYHLAGEESAFLRWTEDFGFYYEGHEVLIRISTPLDMAQTDRDALAAPVLASVELGG